MVSQMVDTTAVILVTHFYAAALPVNADEPLWPQLMVFIASGYVFKLLVAALDTGPIYLAVRYLRPWLGLEENEEATGEIAGAVLQKLAALVQSKTGWLN